MRHNKVRKADRTSLNAEFCKEISDLSKTEIEEVNHFVLTLKIQHNQLPDEAPHQLNRK